MTAGKRTGRKKPKPQPSTSGRGLDPRGGPTAGAEKNFAFDLTSVQEHTIIVSTSSGKGLKMKELLIVIGATIFSVFSVAVLLGIIHLYGVTNMSEWLCLGLMLAWGGASSAVMVYLGSRD
jgi:hypothetical protein